MEGLTSNYRLSNDSMTFLLILKYDLSKDTEYCFRKRDTNMKRILKNLFS